MKIEEHLFKRFEHVAYEHLKWTMANKGVFLNPENFSTIQYCNARGYSNGMKFSQLVLNAIRRVDPNARFLNFGTAIGSLDFTNRYLKYKLNIDNVEWEDQLICCQKVRELLNINIRYVCNSILDDNFVIRECDEIYDYVILERFIPIYKSNPEQFDDLLYKLSRYARKALIVESERNWSDETREHLLKVSQRKISVSPPLWNLYVTDLDRFR